MIDLSALDDDQRAAVTAPPGPLLIAAGAGSGKTRVLTYRVAHQIETGVAVAGQFFVSAFTKAAATEMSQRLRVLVPNVSVPVATFHSHMYRFLLSESGRRKLDVCSDAEQKRIIKGLLGPPSRDFPIALNVEHDVAVVAAIISGWKNGLIAADDEIVKTEADEEGASHPRGAAALIYQLYENELARLRKLDFDDMLKHAYELMERDPGALARARERWTSYAVDECQDSNGAQFGLLAFIAPPAESPNLTLVGDDRQCIFRFRGARPELMVGFLQRWRGANRIDLARNYRSTPQVVGPANQLMDPSKTIPQTTVRPAGPRTKVIPFSDQTDQAEEIAGFVQAAVAAGHRHSDVAVLVRTRAQTAAFERAFVSAGLPYHCDGGGFFDRAEVGDMMAYLRLTVDPNDEKALRRIVNRPTRYLGEAFCDAALAMADAHGVSLVEALRLVTHSRGKALSSKQRSEAAWLWELLVNQLGAGRRAMPPADAVKAVLDETKYLEWMRREHGDKDTDDSRMENLVMLQEIAEPYATTAELLEFAAKSTKMQKESGTELVTIHRSKGRQWRFVVVSNFYEGSIPHKKALEDTNHGIADERRLAYVAWTRAEDCLVICVPGEDTFGQEAEVSRYIEDARLEVEDVIIDAWWGDAFVTPVSKEAMAAELAEMMRGVSR